MKGGESPGNSPYILPALLNFPHSLRQPPAMVKLSTYLARHPESPLAPALREALATGDASPSSRIEFGHGTPNPFAKRSILALKLRKAGPGAIYILAPPPKHKCQGRTFAVVHPINQTVQTP